MSDSLVFVAGAGGDGKLLGRAFRGAYFPCFLFSLTYALYNLTDSLMAGIFFSPLHIAAIGTVLPINLIVFALLDVIEGGTVSEFTVAVARGQRRKSREVFSVGTYLLLGFGIFFGVLCFSLARPLVALGGARDGQLSDLAATYLRISALSYPTASLAKYFVHLLNVHGYERDTALVTGILLTTNIALSITFVYILPDIGIGALALGTFVSTVVGIILGLLRFRKRGISLKLYARKLGFRFTRLRDMVMSGVTATDAILDGVLEGVVNNVILSSPLGTGGLAVYSTVSIFWSVAQVSSDAACIASTPIFLLCFGFRDRRGLVTAFRSASGQGILYSILWTLSIFAVLPLVRLALGGSGGVLSDEVMRGIFITLAFSPFFTLNSLAGAFLDCLGKLGRSLSHAIVPDSILLPLLLLALLPRLGYDGIWLALGSNTLLFLLLLGLYYLLTARRLGLSFDRVLGLSGSRDVGCPTVDASVRYSDDDISELSAKIHAFLKAENASARTSYAVSLSIDELATDFIAHAREKGDSENGAALDVRVFREGERFRLILTNRAAPYNPLDFEFDREDFSKVGLYFVQKIARKIDYNYVCQMNCIMIEIER